MADDDFGELYGDVSVPAFGKKGQTGSFLGSNHAGRAQPDEDEALYAELFGAGASAAGAQNLVGGRPPPASRPSVSVRPSLPLARPPAPNSFRPPSHLPPPRPPPTLPGGFRPPAPAVPPPRPPPRPPPMQMIPTGPHHAFRPPSAIRPPSPHPMPPMPVRPQLPLPLPPMPLPQPPPMPPRPHPAQATPAIPHPPPSRPQPPQLMPCRPQPPPLGPARPPPPMPPPPGPPRPQGPPAPPRPPPMPPKPPQQVNVEVKVEDDDDLEIKLDDDDEELDIQLDDAKMEDLDLDPRPAPGTRAAGGAPRPGFPPSSTAPRGAARPPSSAAVPAPRPPPGPPPPGTPASRPAFSANTQNRPRYVHTLSGAPVQIGRPEDTVEAMFPSQATEGQPIKLPGQTRVTPEEYKEFLALGHGEIFDLDIDRVVDAAWRHPGVTMSDFFNYDLVPRTWKEYCKTVQQFRLEFTMQQKIQTFEGTPAEMPEADPELPPELAAAVMEERERQRRSAVASEAGPRDPLTYQPIPTMDGLDGMRVGERQQRPRDWWRAEGLNGWEHIIVLTGRELLDPKSVEEIEHMKEEVLMPPAEWLAPDPSARPAIPPPRPPPGPPPPDFQSRSPPPGDFDLGLRGSPLHSPIREGGAAERGGMAGMPFPPPFPRMPPLFIGQEPPSRSHSLDLDVNMLPPPFLKGLPLPFFAAGSGDDFGDVQESPTVNKRRISDEHEDWEPRKRRRSSDGKAKASLALGMDIDDSAAWLFEEPRQALVEGNRNGKKDVGENGPASHHYQEKDRDRDRDRDRHRAQDWAAQREMERRDGREKGYREGHGRSRGRMRDEGTEGDEYEDRPQRRRDRERSYSYRDRDRAEDDEREMKKSRGREPKRERSSRHRSKEGSKDYRRRDRSTSRQRDRYE